MFTGDDLLWGLAFPFGLALVVLALLGGWRWGVALGLAAGYVAGHIALQGHQGLESIRAMRPAGAADWALVFAVAAALVGLLVSCSCVSAGAVWLARLLLAVALVNAVLWMMVETRWEKVQALVYVQSILGIVLVVWWSVDGLAERVRGTTAPLVLCLTVAAAAALMIFHNSLTLGKLTAAMAAALLATYLVGLFRSSMDLSRGGMAVVVTTTGTLLLGAVFYGEVAMWAALTVALSPVLAWVRVSSLLDGIRPAFAAIWTAILVLIPLVVAVTPSALGFFRGGNEAATP